MSRYYNSKKFSKNWVYRAGKAGHYAGSRTPWEVQAMARGLSADDAYDVQRDYRDDLDAAKRDLAR